MLNGNLIDYKIATLRDCGPIEPIIVETALGYGPYGSTGIGEDVADHASSLLGPAILVMVLPALTRQPRRMLASIFFRSPDRDLSSG